MGYQPYSLLYLHTISNLFNQLNTFHQHYRACVMCLPSNNGLSYTELKMVVANISNGTSEELTRGQASNKQWFKYRAGRITASQIYEVWKC